MLGITIATTSLRNACVCEFSFILKGLPREDPDRKKRKHHAEVRPTAGGK
jgi:hypothetical protein